MTSALSSSRSRPSAAKKAPSVAPKKKGKIKPAGLAPPVSIKAKIKAAPIKKITAPKKSTSPIAKVTSKGKPSVKSTKIVSPVVPPVTLERRIPRPFPQLVIDPVGLVGLDMGPLPADEVFDEADGAQHLQLREIAETQRRARLLNQPERHPDFDGTHCVDCDGVIPQVRLNLQRVRCVECQQELENMNKRQEIARR